MGTNGLGHPEPGEYRRHTVSLNGHGGCILAQTAFWILNNYLSTTPQYIPDPRHAVALFRYGVIADLVRLESGAEGLYRQIAEKAARDYVIPGTARTRVAAETIRHWLKRYRAGGFDALMPKPRADRGRPRKIPDDIAEALIAIKEAHPKLPVRGVIEHAVASGELPRDLLLAPATVNRLLMCEGLLSVPDQNSPKVPK